MGKATKYLIVLSVDALKSKDLEFIKTLKNFSLLLKNGSIVERVKGVYPSLTYPSHTSIITGTYPKKHGIINNIMLQPGIEDSDWYWYSRDVKVPTLYDIAKANKLKVASFMWPVMAGAKIDYNFPEIWTNKKGQNQFLLSMKSGTPLFFMQIVAKYGKLLNGKSLPELDNFITVAASDLIINKAPNMVLMHLLDLDSKRHKYGTDSEQAKNALIHIDENIGLIISSVKKAGIMDDTTFIVLGDHGFIDVQSRIKLNTEFLKQGLIKVDEKGKVVSWKAFCNCCDGSAYVYLNDKDKTTEMLVIAIIMELKTSNGCAIEEIYTSEQASYMGADPNCRFMLEARNGYCFDNSLEGSLIEVDCPDHIAGHGFSPEKADIYTTFIACGNGIKKGKVIPQANLIDEAPTMAALLGLQMPQAEGRIIDEMMSDIVCI